MINHRRLTPPIEEKRYTNHWPLLPIERNQKRTLLAERMELPMRKSLFHI